ncbi:dolichyl-diphosphooligosaccharide--protein glycosyltransferase subunit STT3A [Diaphorina citri]|uniref:Dolichyl-diphosphooligosaccharide--protein glycosyltransferase subunit STT3A n=1 Tax=Diaphorina citri TaxID=121845 RepID=A0A3Q0JAE4_DIACI|nr:dolichyl-diphosphooligosaccharide--protein glycosyltransferase subunit STT3A [Diaphorina citri]
MVAVVSDSKPVAVPKFMSKDKQETLLKITVLSIACILSNSLKLSHLDFLGQQIGDNGCQTGKERSKEHDTGSGLVAAAMISIVPGYISRSVAGSYDNEAIAIFCMLLTYYSWIKAVKTGSILWSALTALAYFYMVSSWGGYVFLINLIPMHVLVLMITARFSHRIYVAYSTLYCVGTILSMQIPFVGFQPVQSSEHMLAFGVFGLCQLHAIVDYMRSKLSGEDFSTLFNALAVGSLSLAIFVGTILTISGKIAPWTGRFYTLLDPSYAKNHIPIIASVSEHQPTSWSSFFFDLQILCFLFPHYFCFSKLTDANIFLILYGVTSIYFAGVMVRLMLVLAPVMCILSGIAVSTLLSTYMRELHVTSAVANGKPEYHKKQHKRVENNFVFRSEIATFFVVIMTFMLGMYTIHCTWVTSEAYSSPSIVLSARTTDGHQVIFDDFREAYYWLRMNTPEDARVMSWWDYGYQITAMANRTILVDNNTWNNTHISRVGQAMASNEETAYEIMRELDVNYVLVIFGGVVGYSSDVMSWWDYGYQITAMANRTILVDNNTWNNTHISRVGQAMASNEETAYEIMRELDVNYVLVIFGGVVGYSSDAFSTRLFSVLRFESVIHEFDPYFNYRTTKFLVEEGYYKFHNWFDDRAWYPLGRIIGGKPTGYDRVRGSEIGNKDFELEVLEEAYTTEHWLVRIYKVKDLPNRGI